MEERNVKIARDPRNLCHLSKLNSIILKNLSVTWFDEKWNFITLLLLITPEFNLEYGGVGRCIKNHLLLPKRYFRHGNLLNANIRLIKLIMFISLFFAAFLFIHGKKVTFIIACDVILKTNSTQVAPFFLWFLQHNYALNCKKRLLKGYSSQITS